MKSVSLYRLKGNFLKFLEGRLFSQKGESIDIFLHGFCKMALLKTSENFLQDIFSIPFSSAGGNFPDNKVLRNKQCVALTCKSKGDLNCVKDNIYV